MHRSQAIHVAGLTKTYRIPEREAGLVAALHGLVRRRWREVHAKVAEYLAAGVGVVCVIDEQTATAHVFGADEAPRTLGPDEELTLPGILGDFRVTVRRFLE